MVPKPDETRCFRLFVVAIFCVISSLHAKKHGCHEQHKLLKYRATFLANWNADDFPKQYPLVRPHAHWSILVGRSHDENYELWSKGTIADPGFKKFAQEGKTETLDKEEGQGFNGLFDTFTAPAIQTGVGETAADFFVNGNFSKVSIAVRIVPSPDWFVGVDSLDLCEERGWAETLSVSLEPLDAGTDRGFTFTSPNWASMPQEKIFKITNTFPDHRANSFYYPDLEELPHIGQLKFELLTEYRHERTHKDVSHRREIEVDTNLSTEMEKKREELEEQLILAGEPIAAPKPSAGPKSSRFSTTVGALASGRDRSASSEVEEKQQLIVKPQNNVIDCIVGKWGSWSPCSKTCGFGAQKRSRKVTQIPRGGRACPPLDQEKWCGSMRSCTHRQSLFSWLDKGKGKSDRSSQSSSSRRVLRRRHNED